MLIFLAVLDILLVYFRFERIWRGLKERPDQFGDYLSCFKKSTFKHVMKESTSPDLVSSMFIALRDHMLPLNPKKVVDCLEGYSLISNFSFSVALLPENDLRVLVDIFERLQAAPSTEDTSATNLATRSRQLRATYGV